MKEANHSKPLALYCKHTSLANKIEQIRPSIAPKGSGNLNMLCICRTSLTSAEYIVEGRQPQWKDLKGISALYLSVYSDPWREGKLLKHTVIYVGLK